MTTTKKPVEPCVGLCFLEKIGKIVKAKQPELEKEEEEEEEIVTSGYEEQ